MRLESTVKNGRLKMSSIDERIEEMYDLGEVHPLTYTYVMREDDAFKLRFLNIKEKTSDE